MTEHGTRNKERHTDDESGLQISESLRALRAAGPKIVVIGGGTGLSTLLRGLKELSEHLTAIVTVADDGGGSGVLRDDLGMLPPGDIRNCILALAEIEPTMAEILQYRFSEGSLKGQSFGNLFLAALNGISPSFDEAVRRMSDVLAITGRVLPVTNADVRLEARFENGTTVLGESKIFMAKKERKCRISKVRLLPEKPAALPDALSAIREADLIVFGPGSLYTSVIPNLLVSGVTEAVLQSDALKVYVLNVMTQEGETEGYTAFDHAKSLFEHSSPRLVSHCMANTSPIPEALIRQYGAEGAEPLHLDRDRFSSAGITLVERPLLSDTSVFARHDPMRLASELIRLFLASRPRGGAFLGYGARMLRTLDARDALEIRFSEESK
ncbi:YvcK family protein [Oscillospiraceae bacterium OttesenSCG-928-G22]|nr:YvcK family protein [Oscillospiraceae bacterium OttesenSCG-928-G22]